MFGLDEHISDRNSKETDDACHQNKRIKISHVQQPGEVSTCEYADERMSVDQKDSGITSETSGNTSIANTYSPEEWAAINRFITAFPNARPLVSKKCPSSGPGSASVDDFTSPIPGAPSVEARPEASISSAQKIRAEPSSTSSRPALHVAVPKEGRGGQSSVQKRPRKPYTGTKRRLAKQAHQALWGNSGQNQNTGIGSSTDPIQISATPSPVEALRSDMSMHTSWPGRPHGEVDDVPMPLIGDSQSQPTVQGADKTLQRDTGWRPNEQDRSVLASPAQTHDRQEKLVEYAQNPLTSNHNMVNRQRKPFNLLNKMMSHPEIMLNFISHLSVPSLISLYATSKPFHYLFNRHQTTFILANARAHCPEETETIFPYWAYRRLCKLDPIRRDPNPPTTDASSTTSTQLSSSGQDSSSSTPSHQQEHHHIVSPGIRQIPGLKWLQMVTHRITTINQIISSMSLAGHVLPLRATTRTLQKVWFMLDLQTNGLRIGYIHNREIWTDFDLRAALFFFVKLDMRFNDPIEGRGGTGLVRVLLSQRGLTLLAEVLKGEKVLSQLELVKLVAETCSVFPYPRPGDSVLGIPPHRVGRGDREGHGRGARQLLRPDQLVIMEMIRRRLHPERLILRYMLAVKPSLPAAGCLPEIRIPARMR